MWGGGRWSTSRPAAKGIVHPIEAIGEVLRGGRAVYAVDACQFGRSGRDRRAPGRVRPSDGGGGASSWPGRAAPDSPVVREALRRRIVLPLHDLHAARVTAPDRHEGDRQDRPRPGSWRSGTSPGLVGLGAAIEVNRRRDAAAQQGRYDALLEGLGRMPGIRLLAPGRRRAGIASFVHDRLPARALRGRAGRARHRHLGGDRPPYPDLDGAAGRHRGPARLPWGRHHRRRHGAVPRGVDRDHRRSPECEASARWGVRPGARQALDSPCPPSYSAAPWKPSSTSRCPCSPSILAGVLAGKAGILGQSASEALNKFVYWVALPPLLFLAMARTPVAEILHWPFIGAFLGGSAGDLGGRRRCSASWSTATRRRS